MKDFILSLLKQNTKGVEFKVGQFQESDNQSLTFIEKNGYKVEQKSYALCMIDVVGRPSALKGAFSQELTINMTIVYGNDEVSNLIEAINEFRALVNSKFYTYNGRKYWLNSSLPSSPQASRPINNIRDLVILSLNVFAKEVEGLILGNEIDISFRKPILIFTYAQMLNDTSEREFFNVSNTESKWQRRDYDILKGDMVIESLSFGGEINKIYLLSTTETFYIWYDGNWDLYQGFVDTGGDYFYEYESVINGIYRQSLMTDIGVTSPAGVNTIKHTLKSIRWVGVCEVILHEDSYMAQRLLNHKNQYKDKLYLKTNRKGIIDEYEVGINQLDESWRNGVEVLMSISMVEI